MRKSTNKETGGINSEKNSDDLFKLAKAEKHEKTVKFED